MRNALESGVERTKREKEQSKVTQELVERKVKNIYTRNTSKKRRESLTQMKKEENSKVKEYEKLVEIK